MSIDSFWSTGPDQEITRHGEFCLTVFRVRHAKETTFDMEETWLEV